jgi:hypothetical protein
VSTRTLRKLIGAFFQGRDVVYVPLGARRKAKPKGEGDQLRYAVIYKEDFDLLAKIGVRFDNWYAATSDRVAFRAFGDRTIGVARLLLKAEPGSQVQYLNGNSLDLRRDNLWLKPGHGKKHDIAEYLQAKIEEQTYNNATR